MHRIAFLRHHGLVDPARGIAPYEETLNNKRQAERDKWARRVWDELKIRVRPGDRVVFLAGERYRERLIPLLVEHGSKVDVPMKGLSFGQQLQWLKQWLS